jgi:hypothetical protein
MTVVISAVMTTVHLGDCLEILPGLPAASVHAVGTDAPYALEFMGREWDARRGSTDPPRPDTGTAGCSHGPASAPPGILKASQPGDTDGGAP